MKPTILVTNDDGFYASGLRRLVKCVEDKGNVVVVAPSEVQSGSGHGMTVRDPLRLQSVSQKENLKEYICNGTPADCVKIGRGVVLDKKVDLLVSGINHGQNAGINVVYSGTMAAVIESCIYGIPSIGFSYANYSFEAEIDEAINEYVRKIVDAVMKNGLPDGVCLNVNIPDTKEIKGIKICRQGKGHWNENFDARVDQLGRDYYWLAGEFTFASADDDQSDEWAINNGYISIVPVKIDFTDNDFREKMKDWVF